MRIFHWAIFFGMIWGAPRMCAFDGPTRILLLGDSTVITSYLPEDQSYKHALECELKVAAPSSAFEVFNAADNGEFIARYLLSGHYERMRTSQPGADLIVVRFGVNDEKRVGPAEFGVQLEKLLDLLSEDFPGARIILETGIYMDPEHYSSDRNKTLIPYWNKTREIAAKRNLPLSDVYAAMERETAAGNWDLRIRKPGKDTEPVFDGRQDAGRENDRSWFSNVHPNAEGNRVAARELAKCLITSFPERLPSGNARNDRPTKTSADYENLLSFPMERLKEVQKPSWRKAAPPADDLQKAISPATKIPANASRK